MNDRTKFIIYLIGLAILGMGLAGLISEFIIYDFNLASDGVLSNTILIIIGLFILVAGMLFLKRFLKELAIISILFVFVIMAAVFMVKIIFEPGLRMQFLLATIISAILAVILHFISTKSGAYGAMNELDPGMK